MSEPIKLHHQMTTVRDMEAAIHMYRDVFGMELIGRVLVPDTTGDGLDEVGKDKVWGDNEHQWEIATLDSGAGALIELCHQVHPPLKVLPPELKDYGATGHTEQGFLVDNIDEWYKKIVDAGYRPQSEPWYAGKTLRTFAFYDYEDNVIQLTEDMTKPETPYWDRMFNPPDTRTPAQIEMLEKTYK
jgi:catechol 2,3-dioxygenase-like lactoylglutathione lyase family enzyme